MVIKGKLYGLVLLGVLMMPSLCFAAEMELLHVENRLLLNILIVY